jgi:hypothetical protein
LNDRTRGAPAIGPNETNPVRNAATISRISLFVPIQRTARRQPGSRSDDAAEALLVSDFPPAPPAVGVRITNSQMALELNTACSSANGGIIADRDVRQSA